MGRLPWGFQDEDSPVGRRRRPRGRPVRDGEYHGRVSPRSGLRRSPPDGVRAFAVAECVDSGLLFRDSSTRSPAPDPGLDFGPDPCPRPRPRPSPLGRDRRGVPRQRKPDRPATVAPRPAPSFGPDWPRRCDPWIPPGPEKRHEKLREQSLLVSTPTPVDRRSGRTTHRRLTTKSEN